MESIPDTDPDPDPNRGTGFAVLSLIMMILPTIAITLRVWSRLTLKSQRFWWDDWFAIASLPCVLAYISILLQWVSDGLGHHISQLSPEKSALGPKYLYASDYFYDLGTSLPKYSAILFYMRIFRLNSNRYLIIVRIAFAIVTFWILFALLTTIFQCTPIRKAWIPLTPGHCIKTYPWFLEGAISSVCTDVYIMILPLPVLWRLHTGRTRKIVLTGFFFCAYCVLIVSLGRLVVTVQTISTFEADLTWNIIPFLRWAISEGPISIVSICLPHITQLAQRARQHGFSSLFTRREYASRSISNVGTRSGLAQGREGFQRIGRNGTAPLATDRLVHNLRGAYSVSASADQNFDERHIALGQVHLRQDVSIREDERWALV